jgi:hypothetical protein
MNKLEILKRKNIGKYKLESYKAKFKKFTDAIWIDLEESIEITANLSFDEIVTEQISENNLFIESNLLRREYLMINDESKSFIYTDDYLYCGIFIVNTRQAIENCFDLAREDHSNTCFILEKNRLFSFRVNYYDENHSDYPNTFDIQRAYHKL